MKTPYEKHLLKIDQLIAKFKESVKDCEHEAQYVIKKPFMVEDYGSSTEYFYNCKCKYCGKHWVESQ